MFHKFSPIYEGHKININKTPMGIEVQKLNSADLKWRPDLSAPAETHTLYCFNQDDSVYVFQIAYSKISVLTTLNLTIIRLTKEDKQSHIIPCSTSNFKVKNEGYKATNSNFVFEVQEKEGYVQFQLEILKNSGYEGSFTFNGRNIGGKTKSDGINKLGEDDGEYVNQMIVPEGTMTGTLQKNKEKVEELSGRGIYIHTILGMAPFSLFRKTYAHFFISKDWTWISLNNTLVKKYGDSTLSQSILFKDSEVKLVSLENGAEWSSTVEDKGTKYQLPTSIGHKVHGVELEVEKLNLVNTLDILGQLSYFVRKAAQAFISKPFMFLFLQPAKLNVEVDEEKEVLEGTLYTELAYI